MQSGNLWLMRNNEPTMRAFGYPQLSLLSHLPHVSIPKPTGPTVLNTNADSCGLSRKNRCSYGTQGPNARIQDRVPNRNLPDPLDPSNSILDAEGFLHRPPPDIFKANRIIHSICSLLVSMHKTQATVEAAEPGECLRSASDGPREWVPLSSRPSPGLPPNSPREHLTLGTRLFQGRLCADLRFWSDLGRRRRWGWWSFDRSRRLGGLESFFRVRTPGGKRGETQG